MNIIKKSHELTWMDVFDSDKKRWGLLYDCAAFVAYHTGYRYFSWNGYVYECYYSDEWPGHLICENTGLYTIDLE